MSTDIEKTDNCLPRTPSDDEPPRPCVGLDRVDRAVFAVLPEWLRKNSEATLLDQISAVSEEGPRGPALRRLLSRDIILSRVQLRHAQFIYSIETQKFEKGFSDARSLDAAGDVVAGHHRRMLESIREFRRIEIGHATNIRVSANFTQLNVGEQRA